jgi:rSAM/selenodomain-associated transferase 1
LPSRTGKHVRFLIFAKAPVAGAVKTRLARDIGAVAAAQWYRRVLSRTIVVATRSQLDFRISAAPSARAFRASCRHHLFVCDQPGGDLGRRMAMAAKMRRGPCIIIGSDIPDITSALLQQAQSAMGRFDLLIGPARDGGYYLIGFRTPAHAFRLFRSVRWSTAHALADSLANAPRHWRIAFLQELHDIDSASDLKVHPAARRPQPPASAFVRMSSSPA